MLNEIEMDTLLAAAVLAPSADNHHKWILGEGAHGLALEYPDLDSMPQTRRLLTLISLGAVAESLTLAGTALGLRIALTPPTGPINRRLAFTLQREPDLPSDPLAQQIPRRHSNRTPRYHPPALQDADWRDLLGQCTAVEGSWIQRLDAPTERAAACRLIQRAEVERFRVRALHADLYSAVRFDVGWRNSATEGIPPGALGTYVPERLGFRCLAHWPVQRAANWLGAHHLLGYRSAGLPARLAPHRVVLGAAGPLPWAALACGRLLQRFWCQASAKGLAAQVFAASPLYALPGATDIRPALQKELANGWGGLTPNGHAFLTMRLGHALAPPVRAGRPPAASFLAR